MAIESTVPPDKTGENRDIKRDESGRFVPGESGNPDGRPKGSGLNLTNLIKEKMEEMPEGQNKKTFAELFVERLLHEAIVKGESTALKLIINYVDGLPKQTIDAKFGGTLALLQQLALQEHADQPTEHPQENTD